MCLENAWQITNIYTSICGSVVETNQTSNGRDKKLGDICTLLGYYSA